MSLDVVTVSPRTCSGLAYSGVIIGSIVAVGATSGSTPAARSFAMPKSRSFGRPSSPTRMFPGLRSRWTTRLRCAYWTASHTARTISSRARVPKAFAAQYSVMGRPSTSSITR